MYFPTQTLVRKGLTLSEIGRIRVLLNKWVSSCGPEWTVRRLKDLKVWYLHISTGNSYTMPFWGIVGKRVKGPLGVIFRLKKPRKVIDILVGLYTSFRLKNVSKTQIRKFFNSVERSQVRVPHIPFLKEAIFELLQENVPYISKTYREFPFNSERRCCGPNGSSVRQVPWTLIEDFTVSNTWDFLDDDSLQECMADHLGRLYPLLFHHSKESIIDPCVGRISVIQERGCKARFIAMPRLVHQLSLRSLGSYLFRLLDRCPWDCTRNQSRGVEWGKNHLLQHRKIWSVDLSDASNNMPLDLIMRILRMIDVIPESHALYFQAVSKGQYHIPNYIHKSMKSYHPEPITQWSQGQPLGTYPSFAAFSLAHGLLVRSIEIRLGVKDTFRVLGDDIIISNGLVYYEYRRILECLDIPISEQKSLIGLPIGEFAGHLFTRDTAFCPEKTLFPTGENTLLRRYREMDSLEQIQNPTDLLATCLHLPFDENKSGVPLRLRAALLRLLEDERPELVRLRSILRDDVYSHIAYCYFESDKDDTVYSREDYERDKSLIAHLDRDMQRAHTRNASYTSVFGLADACGLRDMAFLGQDLAYLWDKFPEARDNWITFSSRIDDWLKVRYDSVSRIMIKHLIQSMIRKQISDFTKSKMTIQSELLSITLRFLERS